MSADGGAKRISGRLPGAVERRRQTSRLGISDIMTNDSILGGARFGFLLSLSVFSPE
jgi:hypothetical protein